MSQTPEIEHDERTLAVANAGGVWAYNFVAFALLIDVAYRGAFLGEAAWDLMAFVVGGGTVSVIYQVRQKTWRRGWTGAVLLVTIVGGFIGLVIAAVLERWPK